MIAASAAGSYVGGWFRDLIPERPGAIALKAGITFFALKMVAEALT